MLEGSVSAHWPGHETVALDCASTQLRQPRIKQGNRRQAAVGRPRY